MSYPGVDPADVQTMNPVGTQEPSAGVETTPPPVEAYMPPATPPPAQENVSQDTNPAPKPNPLVAQPPTAPAPAPAPQPANPVPDQEAIRLAVKEAMEHQFDVSPGWQKKSQRFVVTTPNGQRALCKRVNTMDLLNGDLLEEMDFYTKALFPTKWDAAGNPIENTNAENFWAALRDPDKRLKFTRMLNTLMEICVVEPSVFDDGAEIVVNPKSGQREVVCGAGVKRSEADGREYVEVNGVTRLVPEGLVRTSDIDWTDKMAIFSELNKPLDQLQIFHEQGTELASVGTEQGSGGNSQ